MCDSTNFSDSELLDASRSEKTVIPSTAMENIISSNNVS